ncbi:hypothetical protein DPX16_21572 [Anabarilius grahami]|uniref:SAM domain-containing protein n=1 Tax=Anabarilius grahami TaxID=495550 RepID=A0A3N0XJV0_ANAGA|nr:hypothetical protein DPX16_21572 [Anabarilius grahami]
MDTFVREKLVEWQLPSLIDKFKDEEIDEDSFMLLDEPAIVNLIPKIGLRLKFLKHHEELINKHGRLGQEDFPEVKVLREEFNIASEPFKGLESHVKQMAYFTQSGNFIEPIEEVFPVYKTDDAKTYGLSAVLNPIIDELKILELEGISIDMPHFQGTVKFGVAQVGTNMVEFLNRAESTKPHPFVMAMGNGQHISQCFVIINGQALEQSTLLAAVDVCFKAFFVFDINYPKQCASTWEFLQHVLFQMEGKESSAIRFLRTSLFAEE